jgi:hypothetical protein
VGGGVGTGVAAGVGVETTALTTRTLDGAFGLVAS